jgi:K+-transporting ATPase KdpF subunit
VGPADGRFHDWFFRRRAFVCGGMREAEVNPMHVTTVAVLVISALICGYLVVALLYPERF